MIIHLANGQEYASCVLCDSGASNANYISVSTVLKLKRLQTDLEILPPPKNSTTLLADGKSAAEVSGVLVLWISVLDYEENLHTSSVTLNIFPMDSNIDVILGLPSLCTVFKKLFHQCIDNYHVPINHQEFETILQEIHLLPLEFDNDDYEVHEDVWKTCYEDGVADEEREIPKIDFVNFVATRTFDEHREDFLQNYDSVIFPPEHRKGAANIPERALLLKERLEQRLYLAFQPQGGRWSFIKGVEVSIEWAKPLPPEIRCNPRPIPAMLRPQAEAAKNNMLAYFWASSDSTILTPLVIAPKPPNDVRICAAYNLTVNPYMKVPSYPIPDVREKILRCQGMEWFGQLDVARAFHQMLLSLPSSLALSVATIWGNYRPLGVPEGVLFGSQYLQQVMSKVLEGSEENNLVLFDNLFFFGRTYEEFCEVFEWILDKCIEFNVVLSLKKSSYSRKEVIFGMEVSKEGYSIDPSRLDGIRQLAFPRNVSEARAALGLLNFVAHFCPRYAELAAPIYNMTKATFKFEGDLSELKHQFELLKHACSECLIQLGFPNYKWKWVTYADASGIAVCGVIVMIDDEGRQIPIAVYSKKLTNIATRWPIIQKEAFALYFLYKKGRTLLLGKEHDCFTDHANLLQIEKSERPVLQNITHYLQQFSITRILHVKGTKNPADGPTRAGIEEDAEFVVSATPSCVSPCVPEVQSILLKMFSVQGDSKEVALDKLNMLVLASSRNYNNDGDEMSTISTDIQDFVAVLSEAEVQVALKESHNSAVGHWGLRKVREVLDADYPDNGITDQQIMLFLLGCNVCQKHQAYARPAVIPFDKTHHRFPEGAVKHRYILSYDFLKLPRTKTGNVGLAMFYNHFSKRAKIYVQKDNSANSLADSMFAYYVDIGGFTYILSGQDSDIMSDAFQLLRKLLSKGDAIFIHLTSIPYRPQGHGTEPLGKKIIHVLRDTINDKEFPYKEWDEPNCIKSLEMVLNFTRNSETGAIPIAVDTGSPELFFPMVSSEDIATIPDSRNAEHVKIILEKFNIIREILARNHAIVHEKRTRRNSPERNKLLLPGTFVTMLDHTVPNKLSYPRKGPYRVVSHLPGSNDVELVDLVTGVKIPKAYSGDLAVFHGNEEEAINAARQDHQHFEVDAVLGYRGNHLRRSECQFLVLFTDANGDSSQARWRDWGEDLDQTIAYETFLRSRSELYLLLGSAKDQSRRHTLLRKRPIDIPAGTKCYTDLRSWSQPWYDALQLPQAYTTRYMVEGIYGQKRVNRGLHVIDIRYEVLEETYQGDSALQADSVALWGMNFALPENATLVDEAFLIRFPAVIQEDRRERLTEKYKRIIERASNTTL